MQVAGIIPVRLESSRLPNKALIEIEGLPIIVHTFRRAQLAKKLDALYVATDNEKIKDVIESQGGEVIMTKKTHPTGSDRIAEAAKSLDADIIVNIQGDEPLLDPHHIDLAVDPLLNDKELMVSVLVTPYQKKNSFSDIKAVLDLQGNILYCSRDDLPSEARSKVKSMWKIAFIVPFRKSFLLKYASWEQTPLEKIEFNEYLRILEHGFNIRAVKVDHAHISVDIPDDLEEVKRLFKKDKIKQHYIS